MGEGENKVIMEFKSSMYNNYTVICTCVARFVGKKSKARVKRAGAAFFFSNFRSGRFAKIEPSHISKGSDDVP